MKISTSIPIRFIALMGLILSASLAQAVPTPPQVKEGKAPVFPEELKMQGIEGMAKVKVRISEEGLVTEAQVVEATHEAFGEAALQSVKEWVFTPAAEDGHPVAQTVTIPLKFNLSTQDKLNARLGREVFVNIDDLTDKVYTYKDIQKWIGFRNDRYSNVIPYPEKLKGSGISEVITTHVIISPDGYALNPKIENLKHKELMMPVLEHLANVRFASPKLNGEKVYVLQKVKLICSEDPEFGKRKG